MKKYFEIEGNWHGHSVNGVDVRAYIQADRHANRSQVASLVMQFGQKRIVEKQLGLSRDQLEQLRDAATQAIADYDNAPKNEYGAVIRDDNARAGGYRHLRSSWRRRTND